jgi:N6-L-threonylcarbamoyladenine synthase
MLDLPYPGGPLIDQYAQLGDPSAFQFSKPRIEGLNFSFSGLKTSILYTIRDQVKLDEQFKSTHLNDLCASIQNSIVSILMEKIEKAVKETGINFVVIAGGVSANSELRKRLSAKMEHGWKVSIPKFSYCTDNAAMIAMAGKFLFEQGVHADQSISAQARLDW